MINQDTFISNEELAKSVSYTTSYMIRLFRRHMGITPQQYAIHLRINKAKKLLSEGKRVSETAEILRFSDANVFSRDFSRICGYPPSEFKRQRMWGNA
jgi:two-component system response regulator YesN